MRGSRRSGAGSAVVILVGPADAAIDEAISYTPAEMGEPDTAAADLNSQPLRRQGRARLRRTPAAHRPPATTASNWAADRRSGGRKNLEDFGISLTSDELGFALAKLAALAASMRQDREEIHTADEKINEALGTLCKIDDIRKLAGSLRQNAGKIEQQSDDVRAALTRLLTQAQSALSIVAGAPSEAA